MTTVVVMGVSGSGKSTVGRLLAVRLGVAFEDGDALHLPASIATMAAGHPLTDADRVPWLAAVAGWIDAHPGAVIACSALRRRYRDVLRRPGVRFVFLDGPRELLARRLDARRGHFMPGALLDSQLATLEAPEPDEHAVTVDIALPPDEQVELVLAALAACDRVGPPSER